MIIPISAYEELRQFLAYDPISKSGLKWINGRNAGKDAGSKDHAGYWLVRHGKKPGRLFKAHRVIWFLFNNNIPEVIDHIDNNPSNNLLTNLRFASESQNRFNSKKHKDCFSGHKNVFWDAKNNKWAVTVTSNYKSIWGGRFDDLNLAINRANELRDQLHKEFSNAG